VAGLDAHVGSRATVIPSARSRGRETRCSRSSRAPGFVLGPPGAAEDAHPVSRFPERYPTSELEPERRFELLTCALRGRSGQSQSIPARAMRSRCVLVTRPRADRLEIQWDGWGRSGSQLLGQSWDGPPTSEPTEAGRFEPSVLVRPNFPERTPERYTNPSGIRHCAPSEVEPTRRRDTGARHGPTCMQWRRCRVRPTTQPPCE